MIPKGRMKLTKLNYDNALKKLHSQKSEVEYELRKIQSKIDNFTFSYALFCSSTPKGTHGNPHTDR